MSDKNDVEYRECPYCLKMKLRLVNYGNDDDEEWVYECDDCGAEIWYWQKLGIERTCQEIKDNKAQGVYNL